jgi:transposase
MRAEILGLERRRRWTDQQKMEIIGSVGINGVTLTDVARRYEITRQQIYTWRHSLKKRGLLLAPTEPVFLPVETGLPSRSLEPAYEESSRATSIVELCLAKGRTLRFDSGIEAVRLTGLIRSVEAA